MALTVPEILPTATSGWNEETFMFHEYMDKDFLSQGDFGCEACTVSADVKIPKRP
jgi:hypothetical protein